MIDYIKEYINSRLMEEYIRKQNPVTRAESETYKELKQYDFEYSTKKNS